MYLVGFILTRTVLLGNKSPKDTTLIVDIIDYNIIDLYSTIDKYIPSK